MKEAHLIALELPLKDRLQVEYTSKGYRGIQREYRLGDIMCTPLALPQHAVNSKKGVYTFV